jgi:hypothetical protein
LILGALWRGRKPAEILASGKRSQSRSGSIVDFALMLHLCKKNMRQKCALGARIRISDAPYEMKSDA